MRVAALLRKAHPRDRIAHVSPAAGFGIGRKGRVFIAGPEGGPFPPVLDVDRELWTSVADEVDADRPRPVG